MLTTTHMLLGASVATRPHFRGWQIAMGWLGGLAPDASVVLMVIASRTTGVGAGGLWNKPDGLYWQEPWQSLSAISNSIPMWAFLAIGAYVLYRVSERSKPIWVGVIAFCVAALLHAICDFPVHTDDAHIHFWPLTDWRYYSPVSYYQSSHYGDIFRPLEAVFDIVLAAFLVWRFRQWTVRILAVLFAVPPVLMAVLAPLLFGGGGP